MASLQQLIPLVLSLSLGALVLAVGMDTTLGDLLSLFRQPGRLLRAILAVNILVPVVAIVLVSILPLSPIVRGGILAMAISPVPPLVPGKQLKMGGSKSYGYSLYAALILLAVIIVPLSVAVISHIYGVRIPLSPLDVARSVGIGVLAPMAVGLVIHRLVPDLAEKLSGPVRNLAMILVLVAALPIIVMAWPAMVALAGNGALLAMAMMSAAALSAGHLLGGPGLADRGALAVTAATRHPGIALLIVREAGADKAVTAAILAALFVGLVVSIPYQMWLRRRQAAAVPARNPSLAR